MITTHYIHVFNDIFFYSGRSIMYGLEMTQNFHNL